MGHAPTPNAFLELAGTSGERWACFFAPFAPYPSVPDEIVLLSQGRDTPETGLERLRYGGSRHFAFSLERTRVFDTPWPSLEPRTTPAYLVRAGRHVVVVPSIDPRWAPDAPADAPVGRIAGSTDTQAEADAIAIQLGHRSFVGRVEHVIHCETGADVGGIQKGPEGLVVGW